MPTLLTAALFGFVAGLRAVMPVAAVSWAARQGWLPVAGTRLAFLGYAATPYVVSAVAATELVTDKLPATPSRTVPVQFGARAASGACCGAAVGAADGLLVPGLVAGLLGSVAGTLAGARVRTLLAKEFGDDLPAALLEDAVTIGLAVAAASAVRRHR